jgi:hypothetical protein
LRDALTRRIPSVRIGGVDGGKSRGEQGHVGFQTDDDDPGYGGNATTLPDERNDVGQKMLGAYSDR